MSQKIKAEAIQVINIVYSDLEAALAKAGQKMDAEILADTVGSWLHDRLPEYRSMPYETRRELVLSICREYC